MRQVIECPDTHYRLVGKTLAACCVLGVGVVSAEPDLRPAPPTIAVSAGSQPTGADWRQWGGPRGNFHVPGERLADRWPEGGPPLVWQRTLGTGFSPIVGNARRAYTLYREEGNEVIVCLDTRTGSTIWEHRCPVTLPATHDSSFGDGPNASPLLIEGVLVTAGITGLLHGLDAESGQPLWSVDLVRQYGAMTHRWGYSLSPIAHDGRVIALCGGETHGVLALNPRTGEAVWKGPSLAVSYAAPIVARVGGQDQIIFLSGEEIMGVDAADGRPLWRHPVVNCCKVNATPAVWGEDGTILAATEAPEGARLLRLSRAGYQTKVEELWHNPTAGVSHWNAVRAGRYVYAAIGGSVTFLAGIDVGTGEVVSRLRGHSRANLLYAGGKLILLDDTGGLALALAENGRVEVVSETRFDTDRSWTPPSLMETLLLVRDERQILAWDLGAAACKNVVAEPADRTTNELTHSEGAKPAPVEGD